MQDSAWSSPDDADSAHRQDGGPRQHNGSRRERTRARQAEVLKLLIETQLARGARAAMARELRVAPGTIKRDVAEIFRRLSEQPWWCGLITGDIDFESLFRDDDEHAGA